MNDLRFAIRALRRQPLLAGGAVLATALAIGSASAVFSVVDPVLFRQLPYRDEARLVSVGITAPLDPHEFLFVPGYFDLRRDGQAFENVTAFQAAGAACDLGDAPAMRLRCMRVDANFLPLLGIAPALGRNFTEDENRRGAPPAALLTWRLWRSRFGGSAAIPGQTITLDGVPARIAGVLPPDFEMPALAEADVLLPLAPDEASERGAGRALRAFARLKPGLTVEQARLRLEPYFQRVLESVPARFRAEVKLRVHSLRDRQTSAARPASLALMGAVLAVLLIACANVANLLLARGLMRDREMALRAALGASRGRLMRLALVESLLLASVGGILGIAAARALVGLAVSISTEAFPRLAEAALDSRVLVVAVVVTAISGLLAGLAPAIQPIRAVVLGAARGVAPGSGRLRAVLIGAQIAASMILLTGAGLLLRSLWNLQTCPSASNLSVS
jgi:predicted permease